MAPIMSIALSLAALSSASAQSESRIGSTTQWGRPQSVQSSRDTRLDEAVVPGMMVSPHQCRTFALMTRFFDGCWRPVREIRQRFSL
jgi:hypothetical protein